MKTKSINGVKAACENSTWAKEARNRERTFSHKRAISHKKVWGK